MRCAIAVVTSFSTALTLAAAMAAPRTVTPGSGTVLVTGASGLVGANVANQLRKEGYTVRAAVRDPTAEKKNNAILGGTARLSQPNIAHPLVKLSSRW